MRSESSLFCRQSPPNGASTSSPSLVHIDLPPSCNSAPLSVTGPCGQNTEKEINKSKALFILCLCYFLGTEIGRCCIHLLLFMWENTSVFISSRGDWYLPLPNIWISFSVMSRSVRSHGKKNTCLKMTSKLCTIGISTKPSACEGRAGQRLGGGLKVTMMAVDGLRREPLSHWSTATHQSSSVYRTNHIPCCLMCG